MKFWSRRAKAPQIQRETRIRFVGEQDGPPEQAFKRALAEGVLVHESIARAYLARVEYGVSADSHVALCLRGIEDPELVGRIWPKFAGLFDRTTHLDIFFVSEAQEIELRQVCAPFYHAERRLGWES